MDASIIVCTYNRAESLRDTLAALQALQVNSGRSWEVIVVDNNSKDHTRDVVECIQTQWPLLRYEFEAQQGLSFARNHGIHVANGEVLLFTDDDVLPEPDWLEITLSGLERNCADACGGFIGPIWETPPPKWLTERFYGFLAIRSDRTDEYEITLNVALPFGANMAFRKQVFERVGLFNTQRGRKGKVLASGEDGDMFERILAEKLKVMFLGGARVHHKIESYRVTKKYFLSWRFQTSKNLAISKGLSGGRRVFNIPLFLIPQFFRAIFRAIVGKVTQPLDEAFNREMVIYHFMGTFSGLWCARSGRLERKV